MNNSAKQSAFVVTVLIIIAGIISPLFAPYSPTYAFPAGQFKPPSLEHVFGTDNLGRDVLSRLLWGANVSISVAVLSTVIAVTLGSVTGALIGISNRLIAQLTTRFLDVWLAFPGLLIALLLMSIWGRAGLQEGIAIGVSFAPIVSRLIRSATRLIIRQGFVAASAALGGNKRWILMKHVLVNLRSHVYAYSALVFAWSLLSVTGLEFVGLTGDISLPSWGQMINDGRAYIREAPLAVIAPGLSIFVLVWLALRLADEARVQ